jgi:NAD(P)-dependent dehydrogenase (short-subunit alcohol dehydrogenase family)
VLITGVTQGIGKVAARELARLGPTLVLVARDAQRGAALVSELSAESGNPRIELLVGDLAVQADIRRIAAEFSARHQRLHVLLNNAGALFTSRQLTKDGYEQTFALNHLGYFLLTKLLLPITKETARAADNESQEARIINVASHAHRRARGLDFDNLMGERSYGAWPAYSASKLANILFTYELARRLKSSGDTGVTVNCLHPGFVASGFGANNPGLMGRLIKLAQIFAISPEEGARTMIYLASSPEVSGQSGLYFDKCRPSRSNAASHDEALAARLWEVSESLVDEKTPNEKAQTAE